MVPAGKLKCLGVEEASVLVEATDRLVLLLSELEVPHLNVLSEAGNLSGLRDDLVATPKVPTEDNLAHGLAVLCGEGHQDGFGKEVEILELLRAEGPG